MLSGAGLGGGGGRKSRNESDCAMGEFMYFIVGIILWI